MNEGMYLRIHKDDPDMVELICPVSEQARNSKYYKGTGWYVMGLVHRDWVLFNKGEHENLDVLQDQWMSGELLKVKVLDAAF